MGPTSQYVDASLPLTREVADLPIHGPPRLLYCCTRPGTAVRKQSRGKFESFRLNGVNIVPPERWLPSPPEESRSICKPDGSAESILRTQAEKSLESSRISTCGTCLTCLAIRYHYQAHLSLG